MNDLLDAILGTASPPQRESLKGLIDALLSAAAAGVVPWGKDLTTSILAGIHTIDEKLSGQLSVVMHHPDFQKLEGTWRGLHYLVMHTESSDTLQIRVLNVGKEELRQDLEAVGEFDQSELFQKVYAEPFGTACGKPFGILVGDYTFSRDREDVALLQGISRIAAEASCPFLSAASLRMFPIEHWTELSRVVPGLDYWFGEIEYVSWRAFREKEDSRFVTLVLPGVRSRLPYGAGLQSIEEFAYEEFERDAAGRIKSAAQQHYTWMNAAYVLAAGMTDAFARFGWCIRTCSSEDGAQAESPYVFALPRGDSAAHPKCFTETVIDQRCAWELHTLGFMPLMHSLNRDCAVFFGAQTTHRPRLYTTPEATQRAAIEARLPCVMAVSRFVHYLMVMARDNAGRVSEMRDYQILLNRWIRNISVNYNRDVPPELQARFPLVSARVDVKAIPGKPGAYALAAFPWPLLPLEELPAPLRCAFALPSRGDFRAPRVDPAWLRSNGGVVLRVARAIRDGRRFAELPVLADALEEAGCTDARILGHCREPPRWLLGPRRAAA